MTAFNKEDFNWDGMYLTYAADHDAAEYYTAGPNTHPSRVGTIKPAFIARFKYAPRPQKQWIAFLVKHFTIEEYLALAETESPMDAMRSKGFLTSAEKKELKIHGLPQTVAGHDTLIASNFNLYQRRNDYRAACIKHLIEVEGLTEEETQKFKSGAINLVVQEVGPRPEWRIFA